MMAATPAPSSSPPPAAALEARKKAVPYKGPAAPPTVDMRVFATVLSTPEMSASSTLSRAASAAVKPRSMFSPWSPSPMARSRSMR